MARRPKHRFVVVLQLRLGVLPLKVATLVAPQVPHWPPRLVLLQRFGDQLVVEVPVCA